MTRFSYGQTLEGFHTGEGRALRAPVFDEHQVRAAAGITLVLGAVALVHAHFAQAYTPLRVVSAIFLAEFAVRVLLGVHRSPLGIVAGWLLRRTPPQWVSAKPKRFAWTLGLVMSAALFAMLSAGVRGTLPLAMGLVFVTLLWLETAIGLCLGCEIHGWLVRRGWVQRDEAFEICAVGACAAPTAARPHAPPSRARVSRLAQDKP